MGSMGLGDRAHVFLTSGAQLANWLVLLVLQGSRAPLLRAVNELRELFSCLSSSVESLWGDSGLPFLSWQKLSGFQNQIIEWTQSGAAFFPSASKLSCQILNEMTDSS